MFFINIFLPLCKYLPEYLKGQFTHKIIPMRHFSKYIFYVPHKVRVTLYLHFLFLLNHYCWSPAMFVCVFCKYLTQIINKQKYSKYPLSFDNTVFSFSFKWQFWRYKVSVWQQQTDFEWISLNTVFIFGRTIPLINKMHTGRACADVSILLNLYFDK